MSEIRLNDTEKVTGGSHSYVNRYWTEFNNLLDQGKIEEARAYYYTYSNMPSFFDDDDRRLFKNTFFIFTGEQL